jgi:arabinofuranosyltransferase
MNPLILRRLAFRRKVKAVSRFALVSATPESISPAAEPLHARRLAVGAMFLAFTYVFLANAWMGDDAYITFRVVWNFVHGYGLTFNPDERVQAFTHPLWALVITAAHFVTREFFFTATAVCWGFCVAAGAVLVRWSGSLRRAALLVAWLLTSKALVDYTASGLENPLSYLLIAMFYARYLRRQVTLPPSPAELRTFTLLASLAFLNRPDAVLMFAIPLAEMTVRALRAHGRRTLGPMAVGVAPALAWLLFATVYYGFPLPNTYYAKVANGIPRLLMLRQGLAYVLNSISHDPITLGTIGLAVIFAVASPGAARRAAASALLYVAYTVSVGGDFMSGRFFTMPFLLAAMIVAPVVADLGAGWAAAGLVLYTVMVPLVPVKTSSTYDGAWPWRTQNGIKDERGHYHQATNILFFSPFRALPDFVWVREGTSFRNGAEKVTVQGSIGLYGLYAGPEKFIVDRNALSDPLLARLPVSPSLYFEFYAGHYFRDLPAGYLESVSENANLLQDPLLHGYYDRLRNVTRGPVFSASRIRDIWALNVGEYRNLHAMYEKRRPMALSVRADNERFTTDVGVRDAVTGSLRATGRAGYLELGPGIPVKKGFYRARWVGSVASAAAQPVGFVEVWSGPETRLARQAVNAGPGALLAEVDFTLPADVSSLEYRFYVNGAVGMSLDRIELFSGTAIPAAAD